MGITVIVPSRNRPDNAVRLLGSFQRTATEPTTDLLFALDAKSPSVYPDNIYKEALVVTNVGNMVQRSNAAAIEEATNADIIGWAADDNLFVTQGWDAAVTEAFKDWRVGMVNTNDMLVGDEKGGCFFIRSEIIRRLGYLLLPTCEHLYVDFAASELFKAAGGYHYLPSVIIEHLHPYAGKAKWDREYTRVNNSVQDERDRAAYFLWRNGVGFADDVKAVQSCLTS